MEAERAKADYKAQLDTKRENDASDYEKLMSEQSEKVCGIDSIRVILLVLGPVLSFVFLHVACFSLNSQTKEEAMQRQEALTRETLEYEAKLRQQTELTRVRAETDGRILAERENRDLRLAMIKGQFKEKRETVMQSISLASNTIGAGLAGFLDDPDRIKAAVITISAVALGIYSAKVSTEITGRYIESRLGKPSLVRDTSRATGVGVLTKPVRDLIKRITAGKNAADDVMKGVILEVCVWIVLSRVFCVRRTEGVEDGRDSPCPNISLLLMLLSMVCVCSLKWNSDFDLWPTLPPTRSATKRPSATCCCMVLQARARPSSPRLWRSTQVLSMPS